MALRKISFVLLMFDKVLSLKELQWVKAIVLDPELWKLSFLCGEYQGKQVAVAMRQLMTVKDFGTIPQLEGQHLTETPMIHFSTISSAFLEQIKHTVSLWKYQQKSFHDRSKLKPRVFLMLVSHGFTSPPSHSCFLFCVQFSLLPLDLFAVFFLAHSSSPSACLLFHLVIYLVSFTPTAALSPLLYIPGTGSLHSVFICCLFCGPFGGFQLTSGTKKYRQKNKLWSEELSSPGFST